MIGAPGIEEPGQIRAVIEGGRIRRASCPAGSGCPHLAQTAHLAINRAARHAAHRNARRRGTTEGPAVARTLGIPSGTPAGSSRTDLACRALRAGAALRWPQARALADTLPLLAARSRRLPALLFLAFPLLAGGGVPVGEGQCPQQPDTRQVAYSLAPGDSRLHRTDECSKSCRIHGSPTRGSDLGSRCYRVRGT